MSVFKAAFTLTLVAFATACRTVREQDLAAWVGMPVEALDTHSFFITLPMYRTFTASGIEIRNYVNGKDVANCLGIAGNVFVNANAFTTCSSGRIVCNSIFYIKDGKVIEYTVTGRCFTDESVRPQARYLRLKGQ